MEHANIRISIQNDQKIKEKAIQESDKRGTHISKTFILNEILSEYFGKNNKKSFSETMND